jgi:putative CocE/NonD family hydrolase
MSDDRSRDPLPQPRFPEWTVERDVFVRMRDGVNLDTDVWLPTGAELPLPTLYVRTPYDKDHVENQVTLGWVEFFVGQGFALVVQSERGRGFSEGVYDHYLAGCGDDGVDTLDWIVAQPWCNGKVGTIGLSSSAETQLPMAARNHPAHAAMITLAPGTGVGDVRGNRSWGMFYRGGIPLIGFWAAWFGNQTPTERLHLPPNSTQAQRTRLRGMYSLTLPVETFFETDVTHLPSSEILPAQGRESSPFTQYMTWTPTDPRWYEVDRFQSTDSTSVPALVIETWHEPALSETLRWFEHLQDSGLGHPRLIIGPGGHGGSSVGELLGDSVKKWARLTLLGSGTVDRKALEHMVKADRTRVQELEVGDSRFRGSDTGYARLYLDWMRTHLDPGAPPSAAVAATLPPVQAYVMRRGWVESDRWPLAGTIPTTLYLGDDVPAPRPGNVGSLTWAAPERGGSIAYVYDPGNPTPSVGGEYVSTAADQRAVEARADVLTYTSAPLEAPLTVVGAIRVELHLSSTAPDTDVMVKLTVVEADGRSIILSQDALRVRYRDGYENPTRMVPGEIVEVVLNDMITGLRFAPGDRIRLAISSSSFPQYERNLNTGGDNFDESDYVLAENRIHHGGVHASRLILPVLPEEVSPVE